MYVIPRRYFALLLFHQAAATLHLLSLVLGSRSSIKRAPELSDYFLFQELPQAYVSHRNSENAFPDFVHGIAHSLLNCKMQGHAALCQFRFHATAPHSFQPTAYDLMRSRRTQIRPRRSSGSTSLTQFFLWSWAGQLIKSDAHIHDDPFIPDQVHIHS